MKKTLLITAIAILSATTFAEETFVSSELNFKSIDANIDGMLSTEEASFYEDLAVSFTALDLDKDGQLSETEFTAMDVDQNGLLSKEELSLLTVHAD